MNKIVEFLHRQPRQVILLLATVLVAWIGYIDYITGPEIGISIFYLVPICFAAYFVGRLGGISLSVLAAIAWLVAELMWHVQYKHAIVPFWNASVRLGLFLVSGALTAEVVARKKIEAALRHQTNILQSILNSMGDGVLVADTEGRILLSNPAAERLLGHAVREPNFQTWLQENSSTSIDPLFAASNPGDNPLRRALSGESVDAAEMLLRDPESGRETWLSTTGRPFRDERSGTKGGVVVFSDISGRKALEKQIAEISEREQRRIGQDLHDGVCQHLVSTALAATVLQRKLSDQKISEANQAEQIADMINEAISQARGLARGLSPVRLEEDGLAAALEQLAEMTQALTGITCEFQSQGPVVIRDGVAAANLYRIAQEAVNNAVKHAEAKKIVIDLEAVEEEVSLIVRDDGRGFSPQEQNGQGMGLHIMKYRAQLIAASLDIRRGPGRGMIVSCSFLNTDAIQQQHA